MLDFLFLKNPLGSRTKRHYLQSPGNQDVVEFGISIFETALILIYHSVLSITPLFAVLATLSSAFYTDRRVRMVNDIVKRKVTYVSKRWDD